MVRRWSDFWRRGESFVAHGIARAQSAIRVRALSAQQSPTRSEGVKRKIYPWPSRDEFEVDTEPSVWLISKATQDVRLRRKPRSQPASKLWITNAAAETHHRALKPSLRNPQPDSHCVAETRVRN